MRLVLNIIWLVFGGFWLALPLAAIAVGVLGALIWLRGGFA